MGLANRFLPYSVFLNTAGSIDAWINQIQSTAISNGVSLFEETSGSETDRQFVAAKEIDPSISIASTDLTCLSTVGMAGALINAGSGTPGATIYARQLPLGALPAAIGSSAHITCLVSDGLLVPVSLRASNNTVAQVQLMLHAILGSTATYSSATPLVFANSQTIPSGQAATANVFTGGPIKFTVSGGSSYLNQGIKQQGVDFGIQVVKEATNSTVYPTYVAIMGRMPKVEFSTADPSLMATIGDGVSVSSFATFFTNVTQNGQRVAAATTTHVSVTGTAGMVTPGSLNLTHKRAGEAQFVFTPPRS